MFFEKNSEWDEYINYRWGRSVRGIPPRVSKTTERILIIIIKKQTPLYNMHKQTTHNPKKIVYIVGFTNTVVDEIIRAEQPINHTRKGILKMKRIQWTEDELQSIKLFGETCNAVAAAAMQRSGFNFDDIEQINGHYETHRWGSDADRRYRKAAVNKAIRRVASNPLDFG